MRAKHFFVFYQQQHLVRRLGASKIHIVGLASVCSEAVVMLLLIHWLFVLSLFVGFIIGPCSTLQYLVSFHFCNHLADEETAGCT